MSPLSLRRLSDERLSGRLASGEAAAFDELYRRYVHRLAAYGGHLLGDAAAGEDVAHVALMNAYQALRAGKLPTHVRPWLYRIAHNAAIDTLTRRRELPLADVRSVAEEEDTRSQPAARGALLAALAELPERQRRAYVLRELHGLRVAEIADELTLRAPQVEQALFSARNRMAELLVFGERLSCEAARRLAGGPLDWAERRAVRSHARSCPSCRTALAGRASALGLLPALDWLRGLATAATGGGGVAAAKIGAAAATATLVAGIPAAGDNAARADRAVVTALKVHRGARQVAPSVGPRVASMLAAEDASGSSTRRAEEDHDASRARDGGSDFSGAGEGRDEQERASGGEGGDRRGESSTTTGPTTSTETTSETTTETSGPSGSLTLVESGHDGPGSGELGVVVAGSDRSGSDGSRDGGSSGSDGGSSGPD